jgi:RNA polymerase sigma factor for flagellar operon FliA
MLNTARSRARQVESLAARNRLVEDNLGLVRVIARGIAAKLPPHFELGDLVHAGAFGLIDAAGRFDCSKGVVFASYAKFRIRGAILDSLRAQDWAPRDFRTRERQLAEAETELATKLQREPSEEEAATRLHISPERVREVRQGRAIRWSQSLDNPTTPRRRGMEFAIAGRRDDRPDVRAARRETAAVLRGAVEVLPPRYRALITMYYAEDLTMKEIGRRLHVNESRISQMHRTAISRMSDALAERGMKRNMLTMAA